MKIFLTEMSYKRKVAMDRISGLAPIFIRHIFALMLFPNAREKDHWLSEIDNFIVNIFITYNNIKEGQSLSKKDYIKLLIEEPLIASDQYMYLKKWISNTIRKESNLIPAFYHNSLSTGELDTIFERLQLLLKEIIKKSVEEDPISKNEFEKLMKEYIWNMNIYSRK